MGHSSDATAIGSNPRKQKDNPVDAIRTFLSTKYIPQKKDKFN